MVKNAVGVKFEAKRAAPQPRKNLVKQEQRAADDDSDEEAEVTMIGSGDVGKKKKWAKKRMFLAHYFRPLAKFVLATASLLELHSRTKRKKGSCRVKDCDAVMGKDLWGNQDDKGDDCGDGCGLHYSTVKSDFEHLGTWEQIVDTCNNNANEMTQFAAASAQMGSRLKDSRLADKKLRIKPDSEEAVRR